MSATVRPKRDGSVEYAAGLSIPSVPSSEVHTLDGVWAADAGARRRGEWRSGGSAPGPSEPILSGALEVFAVQGVEAFPCSITLLDHGTMTARPLTWNRHCQRRYPNGPPKDALLALSQKERLDHIAETARIRNAQVAKYRAEGLSEGDALLKSYRDLADMGRIPRSPRIVAESIDPAAAPGVAVFEIVEPEMASGVFPDIEKAIASPGTEIDKSGRYIVHRDYTTSARLNAWLDGGAREFVVRFRGATYRIEVR
jgi:hypothetical protein